MQQMEKVCLDLVCYKNNIIFVQFFDCFMCMGIRLFDSMAVGDRMLSGMQDFDPKSNHFCPNFASIMQKSHLNFAPKNLLGVAVAPPASTELFDKHNRLVSMP